MMLMKRCVLVIDFWFRYPALVLICNPCHILGDDPSPLGSRPRSHGTGFHSVRTWRKSECAGFGWADSFALWYAILCIIAAGCADSANLMSRHRSGNSGTHRLSPLACFQWSKFFPGGCGWPKCDGGCVKGYAGCHE